MKANRLENSEYIPIALCMVSSLIVTLANALMIEGTQPTEITTKEPPQPYFLPSGSRNVATMVGQTAYLHCRVASLGDMAKVSWIRKRDLHVLSSGRTVFASDQRFQVINPQRSENWTLQIKYTQPRDAGIYECQVNTFPKLSMAFKLNVVDSQAIIQGPEYVKAGSTINLTCTTNQPVMQGLVHWYHNGKILDWEGKVSITTSGDSSSTSSQLTIADAQPTDSGNFTCWPTEAVATSVYLNVVVEGEQPAAMQTGCASRPTYWITLPFLLLFLTSGRFTFSFNIRTR